MYSAFTVPSAEFSTRREKPYKHVSTHAASSFLRTTTPPTMGRAAEPILDDIALRNLDRDPPASGALALARVVFDESGQDRPASDELHPGLAAPDEVAPDELAPQEVLPDKPVSDGLASQAEQDRSESLKRNLCREDSFKVYDRVF